MTNEIIRFLQDEKLMHEATLYRKNIDEYENKEMLINDEEFVASEKPLKFYDEAIKALESYDKIIEQIKDEAEYAYADFDRYKEDILYSEPDELPDDDFRYGLRRAIEIINKHKRESEDEE